MRLHRLPVLWAASIPASAATLHVDPDSVTSFVTITSAVDAASSGDTITIAPGTYSECVYPNGKNLSIVGSGPDSTRIDGTGQCDNTLSLWNGETVTVSELSLQNTGGRAVYHYYSDLTLEEVTISNSGNEEWYGGALYLDGGTTRLRESSITDNTALVGGAIYIYAYAELQIDDSSVSRNQSLDVGGAIYIYYDTDIEIDDSIFEANSSASSGGAIYAYWEVDLFTNDTDFLSNTAGGAGGAIEFDWYGDLKMTGGRVEGNTAVSSGGAVYSYVPTDVVLSETNWTGNTTGGEGGALALYWPTLVQITDSEFTGNQAVEGYAGGALQLYVATMVSLQRNLFCGNQASYGGAISDQWTSAADSMLNNRFVENEATLGGAIYRYAVYLGEMVNNTFAGNSGSSWGGGYYAGYAYTDFRNNAVVYTQSGNGIYAEDTSSLGNTDIEYGGWWENTIIDAGGYFYVADGDDGNVVADPGFVAWSADGDCSNDDLRLASGSAFRDAGDAKILDPDGSTSDIGAYGGPGTSDDWYIEDEEEPKDTGSGSDTASSDTASSDDTDTWAEDSGSSGSEAGDEEGGSSDGDLEDEEKDDLSSCGCTTRPGSGPSPGWLALGFLAWRRRRN
jgi:MYXO-CTERM domain-containing protein